VGRETVDEMRWIRQCFKTYRPIGRPKKTWNEVVEKETDREII